MPDVMPELFSDFDWRKFAFFGLVFVLSAVVLFILRRVALGVLQKWSTKSKTNVDDILIDSLRHPSILWMLALSLYLALATSNFTPRYVSYGLKTLYVLIILSVTMAVAGCVSRAIQSYVEKNDASVQTTGLTRTLVKGVILVLGFLVILNTLGISITPMITALGVGGLAVALALQDTLSNMFAGMHILVEKPIRVGDYIMLDSGQEGYVLDIGWRTTKIRKLQNNLIIIPNSKLSQSVITNCTMPEKRMSLYIPVGVSYDSDPEEVEVMLLDEAVKAAGELKGLLTDPPPVVRFSPGFGESSLDFTVICQVAEFVDQYLVQSELRKRIFKRFKKEGIEIPFPVRTVYIKKDADSAGV